MKYSSLILLLGAGALSLQMGCIPPSPKNWYIDSDGDGYGDSASSPVSGAQPAGYVGNNLDCNDGDSLINPGAPEVADGIDNDCNGLVDDGLTSTWYLDDDGDGYGLTADTLEQATQPAGYAAAGGDCDDSNAAVNPGETEVENSIDDNCNGAVDEGFEQTWYHDGDNDGYGDNGDSVFTTAYAKPSNYITDNTDCDDNNASVNPGASEIIGDGIDNDCNPATLDGSLVTWYYDGDGDGYGDPTDTTMDYTQPAGYVGVAGDCDPANAAVNPAATEVENSIDDNCDGNIDEGFEYTWYHDGDSDGYGDATDSILSTAYAKPSDYIADSSDCNDADAAVNPGATEVIGDGIDNDCNPATSDGTPVTWYRDADGDGYGDEFDTLDEILQPSGYVDVAGDCADDNAQVNPLATEVENMIDDNCNGTVDEGFEHTWYYDGDGDGFGDDTDTVVSTEYAKPAGYIADQGDCDDSNAAINPGAAEIENSVDDNCDGNVDEGFEQNWYYDGDGDGYGDNADSVFTTAYAKPSGYIADNTDCDDADAAVNPGATEVLGDGIDNDCNPATSDGTPVTWYYDGDGDGFGDDLVTLDEVLQPAGYVAVGGDCDDGEALAYPGNTEVLGDGIDNDCDPGTPDVILTCYDQVIEITYDLTSSYTVSGTPLGAGDGTTAHDDPEYADGTPIESYMTVRYDDVNEDGIPDIGGRADVVDMLVDIEMTVGTSILFYAGTVFTELDSWIDDMSATGSESTSNDLPTPLIPGTLTSSTNVNLSNGKLINFKSQGWVRCVKQNANAAYLGAPEVLADPDGTPTGYMSAVNPGDDDGQICGAAGVGWQNDAAINPDLASFTVSGSGASGVSGSFQIASKLASGSNDISYGKPGNVTLNFSGTYSSTEIIPAACE